MFLSRRLRGFYAFAAAWSFNPTRGLWILYLVHCHWTLFEVGLAEAGFHVVAFVAEVPTGLFADRRGRRASLGMGLLIHAITALMTFYLAPLNIFLGIISVALGALAWAFIGGAEQALLYGLIEEVYGQAAYGRIYGRVLAFELLLAALSTALGGWLAVRDGWSWPFVLAAIAALIGIIAVRTIPEYLPEPIRSPSWSGLWENIGLALRVSGHKPGLRRWAVLGSALGAFVTINNLYAQSTLVLKGAPIGMATMVVAAAGIVTAAGSFVGGQTVHRDYLGWGTALLALAIASIGLLPLGGAGGAYLAAAGLDGCIDPLYEARLNQVAPERFRAAILSLPSAGFSLLMIVLFPLAGWAMTEHHLRAVYLVMGLGLGITATGFHAAVPPRGPRTVNGTDPL
ncbi:MFS transporter [Sulfobacillus harzensis]|uniref:MFS transporter n=1 Tax=Sulfobacillus harzensis TaxID=2729629 RepID=A0A7Y0L1N9_9FIRM|nr:MFS transporter [Sulfobacillus harzensis]NMP21433.1 MFS transporter [Sulfobacillus harzensis]